MNKNLPNPPRSNSKFFLDKNENLDKVLKNKIDTFIKYNLNFNHNLYPDNNLQLLKNLSIYHRVDIEEIITTNGSEQALHILFDNILKEGDTVVKWSPTFSLIDLYIKNNNANCINLNFEKKYNEFIFQKYTNDLEPKIFYIASPNSPTGSVFVENDLIFLLEKFKNSFFILDGAYVDYDNDYYIDLYLKYNNIIITRSFSKAWGVAGLRAGYYITKNNSLQNLRPNYAPNFLASEIINYLLINNTIIKDSIKKLEETKQKFYLFFNTYKINYIKTYGNYILFDSNKINLNKLGLNILYKSIYILDNLYIKLSICDDSDFGIIKIFITDSIISNRNNQT
jgi:histidinol-phosphate aminotransferase